MWHVELPLVNRERSACASQSIVDDTDAICIRIQLGGTGRHMLPHECHAIARDSISNLDISYLTPGRETWTVNVKQLRSLFPCLPAYSWMPDKVAVRPDLVDVARDIHGDLVSGPEILLTLSKSSIVTRLVDRSSVPVEIQDSVDRFRADHSDLSRVGFLMMQFGKTEAHNGIVTGLRSLFAKYGITLLRGDDKQYHDDLMSNVLTYMHCASFGVAVFDRLEREVFNPNVSLEVGYMLAKQKPVCIVKDETLLTLPTDLMGKLYRTFSPDSAFTSIQPPVLHWATDIGIISQ